jgi:adenylylsulfate kinase
MKQKGVTIWLTGLSGSGKTTISHAVARELQRLGYKVEILDGDVIRQHLSGDLGFSLADRVTNIRRIGFVADLLTRNEVIVIVAAIAPYRNIRDELRLQIGNFIEVFVNSPLEVCEERDPKGLYAKARAGFIKNFTGLDDPYEPPLNPEVLCRTDQESAIESTQQILIKLRELGYIQAS